MRILDRLVAGNFIRLFLALVIGAPLLFVVGDVVENLDRYLDRGIATDRVALAYLYQLPQFILWSFPIAALIASVFTVHSMSTHREIVAAKAGGVSFHRLIVPMVFLGAILTGGAFWLSDLAPRGKRMSAEILEERARRMDWRADFVVQAENGSSLAARRLTVGTSSLESIILTRLGVPGVPDIHMSAPAASFREEDGWTFRGGHYRIVREGGEEMTMRFQALRIPSLTERPDEMLEDMVDHEEMTRAQIERQIDVVRRTGGSPRELEVRRHEKLAIPAATFIIILFGAPLATSSKRGGAAFGVGASLGSTILYMILLRLSSSFGTTGALEPLVAAWLPNSLFLLAALILLIRVRT
jgi:lipopolysaccharide export system permease protein